MDLHIWFVYLLTITVLILTPGPMVLLTMNHGMHYGAKRSIVTALAGLGASLSLMCISTCGLGALLLASETAFRVLQIVGALYLFYMGYQTWTSKSSSFNKLDSNGRTELIPRRKMVKKALLVGFSNPKDILFFSALFPQFINIHSDKLPQFAILAVTWAIVDFAAMMMYAFSADKIAPWLKRSDRVKIFNRISGSAFFGIATALLASSR